MLKTIITIMILSAAIQANTNLEQDEKYQKLIEKLSISNRIQERIDKREAEREKRLAELDARLKSNR